MLWNGSAYSAAHSTRSTWDICWWRRRRGRNWTWSRLFFIPAAQSPFKPDSQPTPAEERLRLLRLALAGKTWCEVDEQEIQRGGVSYTIDTVRDYARRFPGASLFYLIGADHVPQLPQWRAAEELARLVEFVVIPRPGQARGGIPRAVPRPVAGGVSAGGFLLANPGAGEGRPADRAPGAAGGGGGDPQ